MKGRLRMSCFKRIDLGCTIVRSKTEKNTLCIYVYLNSLIISQLCLIKTHTINYKNAWFSRLLKCELKQIFSTQNQDDRFYLLFSLLHIYIYFSFTLRNLVLNDTDDDTFRRSHVYSFVLFKFSHTTISE